MKKNLSPKRVVQIFSRVTIAALAVVVVNLLQTPVAYQGQVAPKPSVFGADLGIILAKSAPVQVKAYDIITYKMTVSNKGPLRSENIFASSDIPAGFTYREDLSEGPCDKTGNYVVCPLAYLAMSQSRTFTIKFEVGVSTCGTTVTNTATVRADTLESNGNDNFSSVQTPIVCPNAADMKIIKTGPTEVTPGTVVTYKLALTNMGPARANSIVIRDAIPAGLVYNDALSEGPCNQVGANVECPLTYLGANQSRMFTIKFDVASDACDGGSFVATNTATVTSITPDTDALNNASTVDTNVTCPVAVEDELFITQKATATTDSAVSNQKNISLLRFEGRSVNEDILTTSFVFDAAQGTLSNGQNFAFWVDTDDNGTVDTILQKGVSPMNGKVIFDALAGGGYVVPATKSVILEVHMDVVSSLSNPPSLQLRFATTVADYVKGERLSDGSTLSGIKTNGTCATTCEITVTTQQATIYTLRSQGDLYISKSSTPTRPRMALGGTLSDEVLRLQFHAEYEDIDVTNLVFTATGPNASSIGSNVDRIELYRVGETTAFASASIGMCGSDSVPANSMCAKMNSQEFVVPKGSNTNILARLRVKTDTDGSISGQQVKLTVDAILGAKARGLLSSNNLAQNDGDATPEGELFIGVASPAPSQTITGNDNVVVHSKVLSITNASPDANGTAIPSGNQRQIGQFKFSAAATSNLKNGNNKWTLSDIIFNVNATNVLLGTGDQTSLATSDFNIYNKADPTVTSTCTADKAVATDALVITCSDIASSSVDTAIDSGEDRTFVLVADVVNSKIINSLASTLQVSLQNFDLISNTTFGASSSHVRWLDKDNGTSTPFLWIEYPETIINGTSYNG